jgi:hypothetical protein
MCSDQYNLAAHEFVRSIEAQVPVDVVSGVREELIGSYTAPWEALRVNFSISGREDLANGEHASLSTIKSTIGMSE